MTPIGSTTVWTDMIEWDKVEGGELTRKMMEEQEGWTILPESVADLRQASRRLIETHFNNRHLA